VLAKEGHGGLAGLVQGGGRGLYGPQQAALRVHGAYEVAHAVQHFRRLVDDEVGALGDDGEVVVSDQGRDLDDHVRVGVQPGHLKVHPCQHGADSKVWGTVAG